MPEVDTGREMTERLAKWIGRQSIEYTYAEIAKQVKVDEKTVRNIFDEYVAVLAKVPGVNYFDRRVASRRNVTRLANVVAVVSVRPCVE